MAGSNWMDDRERRIRERDGRGLEGASGYDEDRTWDADDRPDAYAAQRGGRDRVFGERESGASYGRAGSGAYASGETRSGSAARGWQDPHYGGVSPAMRQGGYGDPPRVSRQDYRRGGAYADGGRFYGDDGAGRVHREEYGQGGVEYGDVPGGYDAGYSPTRDRYHEQGFGQPGYGAYRGEDRSRDPTGYGRDFNRAASGGAGGYDYERGYGDGGRGETPDRARTQRFEDAGRNAGDFLHRAGEKVAGWFNAGGEGRMFEGGDARGAHRGRGPQGYKRADERINDDAHERLTDDHWLDASNISLSVSGGEVTLSGTVDSREAKHRAERLVEDISGVNHVQNNLRIAKGNYFTTPSSGYGDSVLGQQIREAGDPVETGTGGAGAGQSMAGKKN
ncbi:BON domain-containing protein [Phenylobacterium sp.]|uniref:BON domain-containing protein n=1 Tax=Phenylobacterium sp. TaxID=1871053 RepID=UPI0012190B6E|nr:BON domain-containing protein [Phenylobacterium sp.]THD63523.1 MAG: BON domain-containing protein [Phenylobacterium sp.]